MTKDEKTTIVLGIFEDFKYMGGINVLKSAAPNVSEGDIAEFVESAFNKLIDWIEND